MIDFLKDWELEKTDFSRKIKTPDWCISYNLTNAIATLIFRIATDTITCEASQSICTSSVQTCHWVHTFIHILNEKKKRR